MSGGSEGLATEPGATVAAQSAPAGGRLRIRGDLTTGSIPKALFHQAWPQAAEGMINVAYQFSDLFWAGHLNGAQSIASVGVVQSWLRFAMTAQNGLVVGMRALIARALGQRNVALANHIASQTVFLGVLYAAFMLVAGMAVSNLLLIAVGASPEVRAEAATYMRLQWLFLALIAVRMQLGGALQASGDPQSALKATAVSRGLHMALSPLFMFGWLGFPELGLAGAAVANILAQAVSLAMNFYALLWGNTQLRLSYSKFKPDFPLWRRLFHLAYPASWSGMERSLSQLIILRIVTPFGDVATALFGIMGRMEVIGQFGAQGVGSATGTLVGQNLGAGKPQRAREALKWGIAYVAGAQLLILAVFYLAPGAVMGIFSDNAAALTLGSSWLQIQCFAFFFMGMNQLFVQSYNLAGDVLAPMFVSLAAVWLVEIPLAYFFAHRLGWGALGVPYAAICGMGIRMFFFVPYYFTGRWLRARVL